MLAINIEDLRRSAKKRLPKAVFEFVDGAANDERTLAANRRDFENIYFAPHMLVDVGERRQAVRILGQELTSPFIFGPTGLAGVFWPQGDIATARATAKAGVGYCLSTNSQSSIEQVAAQGRRDYWFQLYVQRDREFVRSLLDRAKAAGCPVLCVTVDLAIQGPRERDERNGFTVPPRITFSNALDYARHIGWLWGMATGPRITFANLVRSGGETTKLTTLVKMIGEQFDPTVTWKDIDWLKSVWGGRMALKGILRPDDARLAVEHGADAVIVSNHGGRQLDGASSAVSALPAIVDAVEGRAEVLIDGGIRRGSDIVKALALGARGCLLGRASLYGLATSGEAGVMRAIEILKKEIDTTLALLGQPDITKLDRSALSAGTGTAFWTRSVPASAPDPRAQAERSM
jgi:L-lactate dehydrogenase (cytochrome)